VTRVLFFKLEEEEKPALLLHLPKLYAETTVFGSTSWMHCRRVVETVQAAVYGKDLSCEDFELEDNGVVPPLIIFYQRAL
jgi:hypothetical protein